MFGARLLYWFYMLLLVVLSITMVYYFLSLVREVLSTSSYQFGHDDSYCTGKRLFGSDNKKLLLLNAYFVVGDFVVLLLRSNNLLFSIPIVTNSTGKVTLWKW